MNEIKTSNTDIGIVVILTTLSIILFNIHALNNIEIMIFLKIIVFFLLGYSLLAIIFPYNNISKTKFFLASGLWSLIIVFALALVLGVVLNFSSETFINILLIITNVFIAVAFIRRAKLSKKIENEYIVCENCRSYYKLKEGESLDDFEACRCGGRLKYADETFSPAPVNNNAVNISKGTKTNENFSKLKLLLAASLIIVLGIILNFLVGIQLTSISLSLIILSLAGYLLKVNYNVISKHRFIANFSKYRFLLLELVKRDIKIKYRRSVLGIFWSFLNPLLTMVVLTAIFTALYKSNIQNFPVYVLVGKIIFDLYAQGTSAAMNSIKKNASIIKKVYVPKYMYTLGVVLSSFVTFALSLIILFLVMVVTNAPFTIYILYAVLPIFLLLIFTVGMGLILATVTVFFRDIEHLYGVFTMLLMYGSAIFYPITIIPDNYRFIFELNPVYAFISLCRDSFLYGQIFNLNTLLYASVMAVIALVLGIILFYKYQDKFILYV